MHFCVHGKYADYEKTCISDHGSFGFGCDRM